MKVFKILLKRKLKVHENWKNKVKVKKMNKYCNSI